MSGKSQTQLSEQDYAAMRTTCLHDVAVPVEVWAMFLTKALGRRVRPAQVSGLVNAYNARRRAEQ